MADTHVTVVRLNGRKNEYGADLSLAPAGFRYTGRRQTQGGWRIREDSPVANAHSIKNAGSAERAVALYEFDFATNPSLIEAAKEYLAGAEELGCWCTEGQPCHARWLADRLNGLKPWPTAIPATTKEIHV